MKLLATPLFEMDPEDAVRQARADIITDFLEVAFHLILYTRNIYPAALFKPRRKYDITVQMSCHPELNQYIRDILKTVHILILQEEMDKVVLVILDTDYKEVEKFVFSLHKFEIQSKESVDTYLLEVEESLQAALLKINLSDALLKPQPPNCTFIIQVHTSNSAAANLEHSQQAEKFPWTPVSSSELEGGVSSNIVPLKTIDNELIKMELHIETSAT